MADLNDIVISSALEEVGVSGGLDVQMDGKERVVNLGDKGDDVEVAVTVKRVERHAA